MSQTHKDWQRTTALRQIEQQRNEAFYTHKPIPSDMALSIMGAKYVGSTPEQVARWMRGLS